MREATKPMADPKLPDGYKGPKESTGRKQTILPENKEAFDGNFESALGTEEERIAKRKQEYWERMAKHKKEHLGC